MYFDFFRPGVVFYDGCFVDTTEGAMNWRSGIFTVAEDGIYQLSFTAKYVSSNRGRFGAWSDLYVNHDVSQFTHHPLILQRYFRVLRARICCGTF